MWPQPQRCSKGKENRKVILSCASFLVQQTFLIFAKACGINEANVFTMEDVANLLLINFSDLESSIHKLCRHLSKLTKMVQIKLAKTEKQVIFVSYLNSRGKVCGCV